MKQALLLIDIQNDYFEHGSMALHRSQEAGECAAKLLKHFRKSNLPVVHIQHIAMRSSATFFLPGTFGAEIHSCVQPHASEKVIVKHFPNSFRETDLFDHLMQLGISRLVVCGMMTHMCVDATVRAAKDFGFEITLISDTCATKELSIGGEAVAADEVQKSFLAALSYFYASVISADEYLDTEH
jgi:nicotinamidase-related amidase